ncbi:PREDICTED: pentatricopeptide repeat-containing protein At5g16860 [Ipomoea nil]|uniref:pentatricopeptide repeat-containing protein At5g16860 n=1 Tax=Ipomoea nil TaxID=35883 RepID=UPI000900C0CB|nr:PREDICTED: pentatricopeptide repeat-containing protein At5g16860 [Ipomoea nil]
MLFRSPPILKLLFSNSAVLHRSSSTTITYFFSSSAPSSSAFSDFLKRCKSSIKAKLVVAGGLSADPETACLHLVFWWNNLIKRGVLFRSYEHAFLLFREMLRLQWTPDGYTFPYVLKACGELSSFRRGESVHAFCVVTGHDANVFVRNGVIAMYGRCGALDHAHKVFDETVVRGIDDVISWNSIVAAYAHSQDFRRALGVFGSMIAKCDIELRPDVISLVNVLPACAPAKAWRLGKQIHGYAIRRGLYEDVFVGNAIVDMYAKCEQMNEANKVFERMEVKDVVSWNAMVTGYSQIGRFTEALGLFERMRHQEIELNVITWSAVIAGYAQRGFGYEALNVFKEMRLSGTRPNIVTLASVLSGCAAVGALRQGKETHCYAIKQMLSLEGNDPEEDLMVINGLIDMYAKCKNVEIARAMFDAIDCKDRNVVTWTVIIGAYAQHGDANEALELLSVMMKDDSYSIIPNGFTISCALMACARLASLRVGQQIHAYVLRNHYENCMLFVSNCLIDMYAKSGDIDKARKVFDVMTQRNTVSWTSLMTGYGMHGRGDDALQVFEKMRHGELVIDGVTFLVVLYACSHSGMVEKGMNYFNNMTRDHGVIPEIEHYACMVDLLGRAGRLDKAMKLIQDMPMEPTSIIWFSLLSACRVHKNVEIGEYAAAKLSELEAENDGSYTLLSNIYANARRWKDVARIRSLMKHSGIKKRPGCSWVQGKKGTAVFFVGDRRHPMSDKIYNLLADLIHRIKGMGYVPETSFALHDVDDEEKGDLLFEHSEKLALAYGILTSAPGMPIRITKNLRVCGDCHLAMTYISKIIDHEIILRDSSRFHHFKNGSCSCRGYW